MPPKLDVRGRNDFKMMEYFKLHGGAAARYGLSIPNFPNLIMIPGKAIFILPSAEY